MSPALKTHQIWELCWKPFPLTGDMWSCFLCAAKCPLVCLCSAVKDYGCFFVQPDGPFTPEGIINLLTKSSRGFILWFQCIWHLSAMSVNVTMIIKIKTKLVC